MRLIMVADDYGRFHAEPRMLRAKCFPLKLDVRDTDITRWLAACEKAGMLRCYKDTKDRPLLEIVGFKQRSRTDSKFPSPEECPSNDGQMTVNGPSNDGLDVFVFGGVAGFGDGASAPFHSKEFAEAWRKWKAYSRKIGKVVNEIVEAEQWRMLKPMGEARAIAMIEATIRNQWKTLQEEKPKETGRKTLTSDEYRL